MTFLDAHSKSNGQEEKEENQVMKEVMEPLLERRNSWFSRVSLLSLLMGYVVLWVIVLAWWFIFYCFAQYWPNQLVMIFGGAFGAPVGIVAAILCYNFELQRLRFLRVFFELFPFVLASMTVISLVGGGLAYSQGRLAFERFRLSSLVTNTSVSEAQHYPTAQLFIFSDAYVNHNYTTCKTVCHNSHHTGRCEWKTRYCVAPLVPRSWQVNEIIPCWVACVMEDGTDCNWKFDYKQGIKWNFTVDREYALYMVALEDLLVENPHLNVDRHKHVILLNWLSDVVSVTKLRINRLEQSISWFLILCPCLLSVACLYSIVCRLLHGQKLKINQTSDPL